jgi:hypothetical protein
LYKVDHKSKTHKKAYYSRDMIALEHEFETKKGTLRWILDLMSSHYNYDPKRPPIEYIGQASAKYKNFYETFDVFTTHNGYHACYSDHDRLIYCKNIARLDWDSMKMSLK